MNTRCAVSIQSVRDLLPLDGLLFLAVFGSQVRGAERDDSDLDMLYVTDGERGLLYDVLRDAVCSASDGVGSATILPHTVKSIESCAKLYGTVEYDVLRGIGGVMVLSGSDRMSGMMRLMRSHRIDYGWCADMYLQRALEEISFDYGGSTERKCANMQYALDNILRACLLCAGIRFPYTRDMKVLYDMLPASMRNVRGLGDDILSALLEGSSDADAAYHAAKSAYDSACGIRHHLGTGNIISANSKSDAECRYSMIVP